MAATRDDMLRAAALPPDDGSLDQAVADLDSKLAAWSGAILRAQTALKDLATARKDDAPVASPEAPAPVTPSARIDSRPVTKRAPVPDVSTPPTPATVPAPAGPSPARVDAPAPAAPVPNPAPAEDEALLASLDPETVRKIQVLRRLSNNKKSVRELLEKVQSTPSPPAAPPVKKSFWRR